MELDRDSGKSVIGLMLGMALQAACVCLFTIAVFTALTPDGVAIPLLTTRTAIAMVKVLGLLASGWAVAALLAGHGLDWRRRAALAVSTFVPVYVLLAYPICVFGLFRAGLPRELLSLFVPSILASATVLLVLYRSVRLLSVPARALELATSFLASRSPKALAWALFILFTAFFAGMTIQDNRRRMIVGDEPHYVIIMESLRQFGTSDLTQILKEKTLPEDMQVVRPHKSGESADGSIYSIHHIGLPLLMIVPNMIGGYTGIMFFFNIVTALVVVNIFLLCWNVVGRKLPALATAALVGLSCPVVFYFRFIYPEMVAALFLLYSYRQLQARETRWLPVLAGGIACALLPWLHVKFVLFSATLAVLAVIYLWRSKSRLFVFIAPLVPSALLMMWFFMEAFGSWLPNAPYGESSPVFSRFLLRGLPGLFLDRNHGVLAFAPFYAVLAVGIVAAIRSRQKDFAAIALLAIPSYVVFASHWMWWGGPCPPGRFIVPVLAIVAPVTALGIVSARHAFWRSLLVLAIGATLALSFMSLTASGELVSHTHFISRKLQSWSAFPCLPLFYVHRDNPVAMVNFAMLALWLVPALVAMVWIGRKAVGGENAASGRWACVAVLAVLAWAGVCSFVRSAIDDNDGMTEVRAMNRVNVLTGDFGMPIARAGLTPQSARLDRARGALLVSESVPIKRNPLRVRPLDAEKDSSRYVALRNIMLYPLDYSVTFHMETGGEPGGRLGTAYVMQEGGAILATTDVAAGNGSGLVPFTIGFTSGPAPAWCDLYFSRIKGAALRCDHIDIEVHCGGAAPPARAP
ncbi:MAG: hypothetical protein WCL44_09755 [bacterium]